jgi:hypothetical protein
MALFQWAPTASQGAWTDAVAAASFNALASNGMAVGAVIDNTTTLDMLAEVSFISTTTAISVAVGGHLAIYLLPLLHDGTSYPTNNVSSATLLPSASYVRGVIGMPSGSVVPLGSTLIQVPYGSWKFGIVNRLGVALNASSTALTCKYRLLVEQVS